MPAFTIKVADWNDDRDRADCESVRTTVFVVEQKVPEHEEWDEHDDGALHVIARDADGTAIGTGRLLRDGHIGRIAVLASWRGQGVGAAIVERLIDLARRHGHEQLELHSQVHALGFYERFGFEAIGEVFDECGIDHRLMRMAVAPASSASGSEVRRVRSHDQSRAATLEIIELARHRIAILTPDLEPALYASDAVRDALRRVARSSRFASVRILVRDPQRAVREGHPLVELSMQLASFVQIRVPDADDEQRTDAFVIADGDSILYRVSAEVPDGVVEIGSSALARERLRAFDRLWERGQPDPNLRRLGI